MALISCTECSKEISDQAASCPGCGAPNKVAAEKAAAAKQYEQGSGGLWWVALGVIAVVVFAVIAGKGDRSADAIFSCTSAVKEKLKSPTSADFPRTGQEIVKLGDSGLVVVRGYVDAENSFGAKIRSRYTCRVDVGEEYATTMKAELAEL